MLKDLSYYKNKSKACSKCDNGVIVRAEENKLIFDRCECALSAAQEYGYDEAEIPYRFRGFKLEDLYKDFSREHEKELSVISDYVKNIDSYLARGEGLFIQGARSTRKTSIACYVLAQAVDRDYSGMFTKLQHIISWRLPPYSEEEKYKLESLFSLDILVIDELDKIFPSKASMMCSYQIIGDLMDKNVSIIAATGVGEDELPGIIGEDLVDKLKELKSVAFSRV